VAVMAASLSTVAHWWLDSAETEEEEQREAGQLAPLPMGSDNDTAQLDCSHLFCLLPPFCFYCFPPFTVLLLCSPPFTVLLLDPVSYFCYEWLSWQCELAGCCRKNRKRHDDIYGKGK